MRSLGFGSSNVPFCNSHLYLSRKWQRERASFSAIGAGKINFPNWKTGQHCLTCSYSTDFYCILANCPLAPKCPKISTRPRLRSPLMTRSWNVRAGLLPQTSTRLCNIKDFPLPVASSFSMLQYSQRKSIRAMLFSRERTPHPSKIFGANSQHQGWPWQLSCLERVHTHQPHRSTPG